MLNLASVMIVSLFVLLLFATGWTAFLWFAAFPMFAGWNGASVVALHVGPPLMPWILWWILRLRARRREQTQAAAREAQAAAEREAAHAALRAQYQLELERRRAYCDCRAVVMKVLSHTIDPPASIDAAGLQIRHDALDDAATPPGLPMLDHFATAIGEDLALLYRTCSAALFFPVYVAPAADIPGEEVLKRIRAIHDQLAAELCIPRRSGSQVSQILFLPAGDNAPNRIQALFEAEPDLPGAVVVAFDSPWLRAGASETFGEARSLQYIEREKFSGKPAEGIVTLLVTNPRLHAMLEAFGETQSSVEEDESLTPFWQRSEELVGYAELLRSIPAFAREELAALPVLAQIHQASMQEGETQRRGVLELTRLAQAAIDNARINAGLAEPPAIQDGSNSAASTAEPARAPTPCLRLVHNAGGVDVAGKRLAALGSALLYFGIDLNPVDSQCATNIATRIGDAGLATPLAQLALAIAQAAESQAAVACAEFFGEGGLAAFFVMPPKNIV